MSEIYVNPAHVNESLVKQLNDLIHEKRVIIGDMKRTQELLKTGECLLRVSLADTKRERPAVVAFTTDYLYDSLNANSEWMLDRVYDQAIQKIEADISKIATLLLENLIEANEIPF